MEVPVKQATGLASDDVNTRSGKRVQPVANSLAPKKSTSSPSAKVDGKAAREALSRRRNAARDSARTKARFDALVLRWQEKLQGPVSELLLKQAAQYFTPSDYDCVIEERVSESLCGYPLCDKPTCKLQQRFRISWSQRKVFDMEEQGSYCSSRCMVASRFYKHQLSEDSVYMRSRNEMLSVEVMSLDSEAKERQGLVPAPASASTLAAVGAGGSKSREESQASDHALISWYRDSLMAKMAIPKQVADANPLQIVEHNTAEAVDLDLSASVGRLQFADIEGFEPEADTIRIKKAISRSNKLANGRAITASALSGSTGASKQVAKDSCHMRKESLSATTSRLADDDTLKPVTSVVYSDKYVGGSDSVDNDENKNGSDNDEEYEVEDDEDDSASDRSGDQAIGATVADCGWFAKLFATKDSNGKARPALSLYGRMWMLVDRITTDKTRKFLSDLRQAPGGNLSGLCTTEYYLAPGDQAMAMRHGLLLDAVARALDTVRGLLNLQMALRHELRVFVSTLDLASNMAVFGESETRLLCIMFALALVRSTNPSHPLNDATGSLPDLDNALQELGTDRCLLSALARRLHESC
ncbi:hypothetical protein H4R26_005327 [Coemansia thaxteri]|uniref:RNA polymerase II subunit B1 CTD phosphatase RPAP2 homolog n=1 Tax=Coemansia thaxteri TaxID=2663907 RepID=A0A9W8BD54_9FUNG|nr:hypothetical protein H4R26_005327 [Coemansia thaxteri]